MDRLGLIAAALVAGIAIGAVGARVALVRPGFHAVAVSASQGSVVPFAWFVGNDGTARVCVTNRSDAPLTQCTPVPLMQNDGAN